MGRIIFLLLLMALAVWLWKSRRWVDALFGATVVAAISALLTGYELLGSYNKTEWQGVALISVGLLVMLGLTITARVFSTKQQGGQRHGSEHSNQRDDSAAE
jgi:thiol:disulfide interchange protein